MLEIVHSSDPPDPSVLGDPLAEEIDVHGTPKNLHVNIFDQFINLKKLNISQCSISIIPKSLFNLKTLEWIDISKNNIVNVPIEFGEMQSLKTLICTPNPFTKLFKRSKYDTDTIDFLPIFRQLFVHTPKPTKREFQPHAKHGKNTFILLSFNILAPNTCKPERFPLTLPKYLDPKYRIPLIQEQILDQPSSIVCLQEVEGAVFKNYLEPFMKDRGFSCSFCQKGRAAKLEEEHRESVHGEATFVRTSIFNVVDNIPLEFRNCPSAKCSPYYRELMKHDETALITIVQHRHSGAYIAVINVHLSWQEGLDSIRLAQIYLALDCARAEASRHAAAFDVVVAGDFNAEVVQAVHACLRGFQFVNVYEAADVPQRFTYFGANQPAVIDFIYSTVRSVRPVAALAMPPSDRFAALPAEHYPSDHVPVAGLFAVPKPKPPPDSDAPAIQIAKPRAKQSIVFSKKKP